MGAIFGFGALGVLAVKIITPFLFHLFYSLDSVWLIWIAAILAVILVCDLIISLNLILRFKKTTKAVDGDVTEEITEYIRSVFSERGRLNRRLLRAFPEMKVKKPELGRVSKKNSKKAKASDSK